MGSRDETKVWCGSLSVLGNWKLYSVSTSFFLIILWSVSEYARTHESGEGSVGHWPHPWCPPPGQAHVSTFYSESDSEPWAAVTCNQTRDEDWRWGMRQSLDTDVWLGKNPRVDNSGHWHWLKHFKAWSLWPSLYNLLMCSLDGVIFLKAHSR